MNLIAPAVDSPHGKAGKAQAVPDRSYGSEDEWSFMAPCLALNDEKAVQRQHDVREVLNALALACLWPLRRQ